MQNRHGCRFFSICLIFLKDKQETIWKIGMENRKTFFIETLFYEEEKKDLINSEVYYNFIIFAL